MLLAELKTGEWSLVIANVALTGIDGHAFVILRELASVSPADGGRIRVLYLVPEQASSQYIVHLEAARLPYVLRPYHLHDFLEKVSDLLVEVKAIEGPLRQVRHEFGALRKKKKQQAGRNSMFASRDTFSYTDEELAEYEKQKAKLPSPGAANPASISATPIAEQTKTYFQPCKDFSIPRSNPESCPRRSL